MSFDGLSATLCFVIKITLPSHTVRFVDGGTVTFNSEVYTSEDSIFGQIVGFDDFTSGSGDEAPAFEIEWSPKSASTAAQLSAPEYQKSPVEVYALSINRATNAVLSQRRLFTGIVDYTELEIATHRRALKMGFTTEIDRFFNTDKGGKLNSVSHQANYSGENGLNYTTGTTLPMPWGQVGTANQGTQTTRTVGIGGATLVITR